jgi:ubiquinol-cytochrome c reductase cytochrome c subunit
VRFVIARLSAARRRRAAAPVVLLLALLCTGGTYAVLAPASAESSAADSDLVNRGRDLFLVGCSSCHGDHGQGIITQDGTQYGPPLVGVGAASVDFQVGTGRMPMVQPGAQVVVKKTVYTPDEIEALAAFVASLGPGPAIPEPDQYDPATIPEDEREEAVVRGGQFFRTNCTACHNFAAAGGALPGGKYAPSLGDVEPRHIYEALITGPQQMPVFSDEVLTPEEKRQIISYIQTITEQPGYGGAKLGSLGPVTEGLVGWVVGVGVLTAFAVWIAAHTARTTRRKAES